MSIKTYNFDSAEKVQAAINLACKELQTQGFSVSTTNIHDHAFLHARCFVNDSKQTEVGHLEIIMQEKSGSIRIIDMPLTNMQNTSFTNKENFKRITAEAFNKLAIAPISK